MRKFRFRGKSIKDGEWVEGYFAVLHIPVEEIIDGVLKRTGYKETVYINEIVKRLEEYFLFLKQESEKYM